MKLSTKSRYALETLVYMAAESPDSPINSRVISENTNISAAYLEQIFFLLKKAGILKAIRGARGGFIFARPVNQITAGEIILILEGSLVPVKCAEDINACTSKIKRECVSRNIWIKVSNAISECVNSVTIQELADGYLEKKRSAKN